MTDKEKIKELNQRIDEVLYYGWDPIWVSNEPCARTEYSSFTMTILNYVLKEDLNQIANQLGKIETDSMGLKSDKDRNLKVAQRLLDYNYAVNWTLSVILGYYKEKEVIMISNKELKESLKRRIDNLSEDKLNDVSHFMESLEIGNNKGKLLSFAGSWSDMDDETFNELTNRLEDRRKNNRTRFF